MKVTANQIAMNHASIQVQNERALNTTAFTTDLAKVSDSLPWAKSMISTLDLERRNTLRDNTSVAGFQNRLLNLKNKIGNLPQS
jgi:hypothetical protein